MKNIRKCILIIAIIFLVANLFLYTYKVQAAPGDDLVKNVTTGGENFLNSGQNAMQKKGLNLQMDLIVAILNVLFFFGCAVVIIVTFAKVIKYANSNSPEERANIKNGLGGWILGCVIVIGAFVIVNFIVPLFDNSNLTQNITTQIGKAAQGLSDPTTPFATFINTAVRAVQIAAIAFFIIRVTVDGIRLFSVSARPNAKPDDKIHAKERMYNGIFWAVIAFGVFGIFDIIYNAFYG